MRRLKKREERGSVTLFVLVSMMFFLIFLTFTYMNQADKINNQKRQIDEIQKQYNVDDEMDSVYYKIRNQ